MPRRDPTTAPGKSARSQKRESQTSDDPLQRKARFLDHQSRMVAHCGAFLAYVSAFAAYRARNRRVDLDKERFVSVLRMRRENQPRRKVGMRFVRIHL